MGFLAPSGAVIAAALARAMQPPPRPDITRWCIENVEFDDRSPFAGPFDPDRFPFLAEVHEVLNPEHPAREVTLRGSAQWGKTVSVIQPTLACWHETMSLDSLVVHPTMTAAKEWVMNKWLPMRRQAPGLRALFGDGRGGDNMDSLFNQETLNRNGSLKVASAGSPADLTGTTRRLVVLDDLSKFDMTDKGDPEQLAVSRAAAFDEAKIVRVSTPMIEGSCRISRAFDRSDRRFYHVPCPHCANMAPLTWENFRKNIDPERLHAAHFTCEACGAVILHSDKERIVRAGKWVATHPGGDHPGFHLWRAYVPQRDWASIAVEYAQVMGWTGLTAGQAADQEVREGGAAETEQTFWNDVLGLPFKMASGGPDWEALRNRVEKAEEGSFLPQGVVPACGVYLTAGVDCQADRIEVTIAAYGSNYRRWVIEHRVIPHYIGDNEGRAALDALLKASWRTELGLRLPLDLMAIDQGAFTEDVKSFARRHPLSQVIRVKGATTATGPVLVPMKDRRGPIGRVVRDRGGWMLNVSQIKADFFQWLAKADPEERGYVAFAVGLGDEYYRQITSEVRVLRRSSAGVTVSRWETVDTVRRNECLDCMNYSEAAARRLGWASMTDEQWARLADVRGVAPKEQQADLFDAVVAPAIEPGLSERAMPERPRAPAPPVSDGKRQNGGSDSDGSWVPEIREGWV
jgi:phage terminase large subunit GpA-like protein